MTIEQLIKVIARLLNISEAQAKTYLEEENGEDALAKINADALQKKFDDGNKKGIGKSLKDLVKAFESEFDFDVTGTTPEEISASLKAGFETTKGSEISEDSVKASETYKSLQAELTRTTQEQNKLVDKRVKEAMKEKDADYQKQLKAAKRESLDTDLYVKAEKWLTDKKAILHEDPVKRQKQIKELAGKLAAYEIERDGDGFLISKEGKAATTKDGHNASLDNIFEEFDHLYVFQDVKQRKSSGLNPNGSGGGGSDFKHYKGEVPKSKEEMDKIYLDFSYGKIEKDAFQEVKTAYEAATDK